MQACYAEEHGRVVGPPGKSGGGHGGGSSGNWASMLAQEQRRVAVRLPRNGRDASLPPTQARRCQAAEGCQRAGSAQRRPPAELGPSALLRRLHRQLAAVLSGTRLEGGAAAARAACRACWAGRQVARGARRQHWRLPKRRRQRRQRPARAQLSGDLPQVGHGEGRHALQAQARAGPQLQQGRGGRGGGG